MDADYHQNQNDSNMFGGRKRKGRSRFSHAVAQKKPVFDPGVLLRCHAVSGNSAKYKTATDSKTSFNEMS